MEGGLSNKAHSVAHARGCACVAICAEVRIKAGPGKFQVFSPCFVLYAEAFPLKGNIASSPCVCAVVTLITDFVETLLTKVS